MFDGLRHAARERYTLRHVASLIVVFALVYAVTGEPGSLVGLGAGLVVVETTNLLRETPGVDERWVGVGTGAFVVLGSLAWFAYEVTVVPDSGGPVWFPLVVALAGVWLLLDARQASATGAAGADDEFDDLSASESMLVMHHASLVTRELRDGPKTVPELAASCDLTESRVREALAVATHDDTVYRVDDPEAYADERTDDEDGPDAGDGTYTGRYALDESKVGGAAFVRENGKRVVRRLIRPLRF
ncbi:hypothetical protein ACFPYI_10370 [Halomarina salina]|uniref:Uncharacterized protein n=1 Tax=Halomarina salina TaxID=1872699 RepID=A0ABD5RM63_9EURY